MLPCLLYSSVSVVATICGRLRPVKLEAAKLKLDCIEESLLCFEEAMLCMLLRREEAMLRTLSPLASTSMAPCITVNQHCLESLPLKKV